MSWHSALTPVTLTAAMLVPVFSSAQPEPVPFDEDRWQITAGQVVEHLGRPALRGSAMLKDLKMADGVIEVDIAVDGRRCFPGIRFHLQDAETTELVYLRPHRPSAYAHALQYAPVINGMTAWQLYSGGGLTSTAEIPANQWIHLRLELLGQRARLYYDGSTTPALTIDRLALGADGGQIGLAAPPGGQVHWSAFSIDVSNKPVFGPDPIHPPAEDMLRQWEVSQSFPLAAVDRTRRPEKQSVGAIQWQPIEADLDGLVNISRAVRHSGGLDCVFARTSITLDRPARKRLDIGYSDEVTVLVDGQPVFSGSSSFRARDDEFMGVIGLHDTVHLDLDRGRHELLFAVTEAFGGWAVQARLREDSGPVRLHRNVKEAWSSSNGWRMPESVAVDEANGVAFVSNMNPGPQGFAESGFITRLSLDGTIDALEWATGLRGPTGVALHGDRLLVVERTGLAEIDITTGDVVQRHEHAGAFFNDVAVANDGTVYVTDSRAGIVYRVVDGEWSRWLDGPDFAGANGVAVSGQTILVGASASGQLLTVDRASGELVRQVDLAPAFLDGLTATGAGAALVTDYTGRLLHVDGSGQVTTLLDRQETAMGCADFGWAPEHGLVIIPSLRGHTVDAFTAELVDSPRSLR